MTRMIVKTDSLNLRSAPQIDPSNIIRALPLAQEVTVISGAPTDRFWEVDTVIDGSTQRGFVSAAFLRSPTSAAKEALMQFAVREWLRFDRGDGLEHHDPYYKYVGEYWDAIGLGSLDGRDRDQPWSAAFISYVVRRAGYSGFKFSPAHAKYIRDAIDQRKAGVNAPFWGFRLDEHKPQLGDLVCFWRGTPVSFDNLPDGGFKSHCDIVVEIRDSEVRAMGGNVNHSVSISSFPLNANGYLKPARNVFAVLRNNL